ARPIPREGPVRPSKIDRIDVALQRHAPKQHGRRRPEPTRVAVDDAVLERDELQPDHAALAPDQTRIPDPHRVLAVITRAKPDIVEVASGELVAVEDGARRVQAHRTDPHAVELAPGDLDRSVSTLEHTPNRWR